MQGNGTWGATTITSLRNMREEFLKKNFLFLSDRRRIERNVKKANNCENTKQSEAVTSNYSITRSRFVPSIKKLAKVGRKFVQGKKLNAAKRNDDKSSFVSVTALDMLYNQSTKLLTYPVSHLLSNNASRYALMRSPVKRHT